MKSRGVGECIVDDDREIGLLFIVAFIKKTSRMDHKKKIQSVTLYELLLQEKKTK